MWVSVTSKKRERERDRFYISVTHIIICIINRRVIARDRSKSGGKELARLRIARSLRAEGVTRASRGPDSGRWFNIFPVMSISSPVCSENNVGRGGSSVSSRKTTCTDEPSTAIAVPPPLVSRLPSPTPVAEILLIYSRVLSASDSLLASV